MKVEKESLEKEEENHGCHLQSPVFIWELLVTSDYMHL